MTKSPQSQKAKFNEAFSSVAGVKAINLKTKIVGEKICYGDNVTETRGNTFVSFRLWRWRKIFTSQKEEKKFNKFCCFILAENEKKSARNFHLPEIKFCNLLSQRSTINHDPNAIKTLSDKLFRGISMKRIQKHGKRLSYAVFGTTCRSDSNSI